MTKQKRMVYIYDENLEFYEGLENKSEFINRALLKGRLDKPKEDPNNIDFVKHKLEQIDLARRAEAERRFRRANQN